MLSFFSVLRTHWQAAFILFLMLFSFFAGYRLKSLVVDAGEVKSIEKQDKANYNASGNFERTQAEINTLYDNINQGMIYESDTCPISISGLRALTEATAKTR